MTDAAFWAQVWLSVIDKLLLGGVAGALGFFAAKRLEDYRTRQALRTAIAQKRVEVIAEVWKAIADYENHCFQQSRTVGIILLDALKRSGIVASSLEPGETLDELLDQLMPHDQHDLPDAEMATLQRQVAPHTLALLQRGNDLKRIMGQSRFWLGPNLTSELQDYCADVTDAFGKLTTAPAARVAFAKALALLKTRRAEAATIVDKLLK